MAVRYSGDTEIRVSWNARRGMYEGTVVDPWLRWSGSYRPRLRAGRDGPRSPKAYDAAAEWLGQEADRWARSRGRRFHFVRGAFGRIKTERVFQAPCPCGHLD